MKRANSTASDLDFLKTLWRYLKRWSYFIWERFNPPSHLVMIALFTLGTGTLAGANDSAAIVNAGMLATMFFFRLRLFDEIKDYETDITVNPTRPLPRGLLSIFDLKIVLVILLCCEAILVTSVMSQALLAWSIAALWSLLMYKEFFIPDLIRPHLTTYATSHTLVTLPLTLAMIAGMKESAHFTQGDYLSAIGAWLVFNIFELGRKTFQPMEERKGVESYSRIWGRYGATLLVIGHAALAGYAFIIATNNQTVSYSMLFSVVFLTVIAAIYLIVIDKWTGVLWRVASSLFIILVYGLLAAIPFMR